MIKGRFGQFLIVATVAIVLVLSIGMQNAKAESLLFPYFKSAPNNNAAGEGNIYSFLTLVDTWGDLGLGDNLFYTWNYDDLSTAALECIHEDSLGTSTAFDLIQQTVADPSNTLLDLPLTFGDASTASYTVYPIPPEGIEGFMVVESIFAAEGDFYGQMIVVDSLNGVIVSYKGLNNPLSLDSNDFNSISTSHLSYLMSNYPAPSPTYVDTEWYVLVTGVGMTNPGGWGGTASLINGFSNVWDRDETPRSGAVSINITCFDRVDRANIMTAAQEVWTNNGGLWWQLTTPDPLTGATGTLVSKIETSTAFGPLMQTISSENAFFNDPY